MSNRNDNHEVVAAKARRAELEALAPEMAEAILAIYEAKGSPALGEALGVADELAEKLLAIGGISHDA